MAKILLLDDDQAFSCATSEVLDLLGHQVRTAATVEAAKRLLGDERFDLAIIDLMLPDGSGLQVLDTINGHNQPGHIAIVTGHPSVKSLVKNLYGPDLSYLLKPLDLAQIRGLLAKVEPSHRASDRHRLHFGCLIGESPPMKRLYDMIEKVAASKANVMLLGESGVGKELVARAIHHASRSSGPFVAANCGSLSRELIGSELFGHEKGAFTGAVARKAGLFERARGGSLFLDEVTEMPLDLQANLLRVLETGVVTRVGGVDEIPLSCRIVSATNRSVTEIAAKNCLREDLYFRLAVFPIQVPPLRERIEDIAPIVDYFLATLNEEHGTALSLRAQDLARIEEYGWPGNVRELRHAVHRAYILTPENHTSLHWPDDFGSPFAVNRQMTPSGLRVGKTISEIEKELIEITLAHLQGDKRKAAELLGISLKTLYNRLNEYEGIASHEGG